MCPHDWSHCVHMPVSTDPGCYTLPVHCMGRRWSSQPPFPLGDDGTSQKGSQQQWKWPSCCHVQVCTIAMKMIVTRAHLILYAPPPHSPHSPTSLPPLPPTPLPPPLHHSPTPLPHSPTPLPPLPYTTPPHLCYSM